MKVSTVTLCVIACIYNALLVTAEDITYDLLEGGTSQYGSNSADTKLDEKRFAPGQGDAASLSGFWKKRSKQQQSGFWKRADPDKGTSGFWKRQPGQGASQFWKRGDAEIADDTWQVAPPADQFMTSYPKKSYGDQGVAAFWKRSGGFDFGNSRYGGMLGGKSSGFWKRGGVPWNLMVPAEYREKLYKSELEKASNDKDIVETSNSNPLPPMNRRKGPRHNPDFNPTGW